MTASCPATRHGTALAYQVDRCRCPDAREHQRLYRKRHRERRLQAAHIDVTGTARRLRALAAIGWPAAALAHRLGRTPGAVQRWRAARIPRIRRDTAAQIVALYDRLSATPGPSIYTRGRATGFGWAPPLLWDDVDIDDPAARPAKDDRRARGRVDLDDVDHLTRFGMPLHAIADRLHVDVESIAQARRRADARAALTRGGQLAS